MVRNRKSQFALPTPEYSQLTSSLIRKPCANVLQLLQDVALTAGSLLEADGKAVLVCTVWHERFSQVPTKKPSLMSCTVSHVARFICAMSLWALFGFQKNHTCSRVCTQFARDKVGHKHLCLSLSLSPSRSVCIYRNKHPYLVSTLRILLPYRPCIHYPRANSYLRTYFVGFNIPFQLSPSP